MTWSVYAVSVARKSAPTVKVLEQHVRALSPEDAETRVLRDQGQAVCVLEPREHRVERRRKVLRVKRDRRIQAGLPPLVSSISVRRPCSIRETAEALASDQSGTRDVSEPRWRNAFTVACHELGVEE